ncbi:MAG: hypothetical protein ACI81L_002251 [Verrucomicrobiales bacterium]|jgi:hypothetical protein
METLTNTELWQQLSDFEFDEPEAQQPFSRRLAGGQRWSGAYTDRVIVEYRRFLYLTQVVPHEVTPSKPIDAIWHLHLTYTESYWNGICALLESPLHHRPTMGGQAEKRRHHAQYRSTLDSYERVFGAPAPTDIWPLSDARPGLLDRLVRRALAHAPESRFDAFYDKSFGRVGGGCGG